MSKHRKVDQRSAQSREMQDSAGTWHVQRAQASRVGKTVKIAFSGLKERIGISMQRT